MVIEGFDRGLKGACYGWENVEEVEGEERGTGSARGESIFDPAFLRWSFHQHPEPRPI